MQATLGGQSKASARKGNTARPITTVTTEFCWARTRTTGKTFFTLSSSTIISEPTDCNPGQADQCFNAKQVTVFTAE